VTSPDERPLVTADEVARTFGKGPAAVVAVYGATCRVERGDRIAVTGPSGSGKSTLLHLLAGLDSPTTGAIAWPGIGTKEMLRPGPVAVVFQAPSLMPALDVLENVALPLVLAGTDDLSARSAAVDALALLGLSALAAKVPDELSGGQAQRVAVARSLVANPKLIVADEPTGQLDHATAAVVIDALLSAALVSGAALLVATHDPRVAERFARRWAMDDGRLRVAEEAACSR
jgi:ABC-type lipoprotein export system ATPase subunit